MASEVVGTHSLKLTVPTEMPSDCINQKSHLGNEFLCCIKGLPQKMHSQKGNLLVLGRVRVYQKTSSSAAF